MAVRPLNARVRHVALAWAPFAEGLGLAIVRARLAPLPFALDGLWWLTLVPVLGACALLVVRRRRTG